MRAMPVAFSDPGWTIRNVSCTGSNLTRACTFSSHTAYGIYSGGARGLQEPRRRMVGHHHHNRQQRCFYLHRPPRTSRRHSLVAWADADLFGIVGEPPQA